MFSLKNKSSRAKITVAIMAICVIAVTSLAVSCIKKSGNDTQITSQEAFGKSWLKTSGLENTRIAFFKVDGYLFLANPDGSDATPVTGLYGHSQAWSPDGSQIAFSAVGTSDDHFDLFVANIDGSEQQQIIARGDNPVWSPDGKQLAYTSFANNTLGLYVMNTDGSQNLKLDDMGSHPSWSPDGSKIAYTLTGIWIINTDGSGKTELSASGQDPAWSPDGAYIAYMENDPKKDAGIYLIKPDGSGKRLMVSSKYGASGPAWSPDSSMIAYMSFNKRWGIYVVRISDGKHGIITESTSSCWYPSWSPFLK